MTKGLPPLYAGTKELLDAVESVWSDSRTEKDLKRQLEATREQLLRANAAALAQQSLANTMLNELKAEEAGQRTARRLSDPGNRDARVAHVVLAEEEHLKRLSGGHLHVDVERLRRARRARP